MAYQATTSDPVLAAVLKAVKAQILLDMGERRQGESLLREALVEMRSDGVSNDEMAPFRKRLAGVAAPRSEEHTSELQSLMRISYAVFCLKKKKLHKTELVHAITTAPHILI